MYKLEWHQQIENDIKKPVKNKYPYITGKMNPKKQGRIPMGNFFPVISISGITLSIISMIPNANSCINNNKHKTFFQVKERPFQKVEEWMR